MSSMQFPSHGDKHGHPSYVTAEMLLEHRGSGGDSQMAPPEVVIVTWQGSLLSYAVEQGASKIQGWSGGVYELSPTVGFARLPIGAPVAAVIIEEMAALGVRTIIGIGTAGALSPELALGDISICSAAVRDEGTSHHYAPPERLAYPDTALVNRLRDVLPDAHHGPTWTTDAPYRETLHEIESYRRQGVLVVEMEAAAMYVVAATLGVQTATVVCVSDLLHGDTWQPDFSSDTTTNALRRTFDTVRNMFDVPRSSPAG